jgi:hypothetical protein
VSKSGNWLRFDLGHDALILDAASRCLTVSRSGLRNV